MGTLGKIRNRSGLLLTVIGFAMLAFILGDFMQSKRSGGSSTPHVGEILGESILIQKFEETVELGKANWQSQNQNQILSQTILGQIRNQAWDQLSREMIMDNQYNILGLSVSDEEWIERISGVNVHPDISQIQSFQDPNTGQFDRTKVLGYLQQIEQDPSGESVDRWIDFQKYLINSILNEKYNKLIEKGSYVNSLEAKNSFNEGVQNITFNYLSVPFNVINDSTVLVSDKEIKKYYNSNKDDFKQDPTRDVEFISFNVVASIEDDIETKNSISSLVDDFTAYDDYSLIVKRNTDNQRAKFSYLKESELKNDSAFALLLKSKKGTVIGPYKPDVSVYRIAKLVDVMNRPDSVEARHILITPTNEMSIDSVNLRITSLKELIKKGADFSKLAELNSVDQQSAKVGGELGWFEEGVMLEEFNDICFTAKKSELNIVTTQFGVHLVQVISKSRSAKKYKVVYIDRNIEPSTDTYNEYYTKAAQIVNSVVNDGLSFDSVIQKENLVKRSDVKLTADKANVAGIPNSREMVKWLNKANLNELSNVFEFENSYVVALLTNINEEGFRSIEDSENRIIASVRKEKKSEIIIDRLSQFTNLDEMGNEFSLSPVKNQNTKLSNLTVQELGYAADLVGTSFGLEPNSISAPFMSRNSVLVVETLSRDDYRDEGDFSNEQKALTDKTKSYNSNAAFNTLKTEANIQDNRSEVY
jgi:peptidyl-prolyl cis-trans isomerase D|tara:strand:- start:2086 stop:4191 length:2106 start_codon:yes stop_codon:yes gene_type:complete